MAVGSYAFYVIIAAALSDLHSSLPVNEDITATSGGAYQGFQVLELTVVGHDATKKLTRQLENEYKVDIWGRPSQGKIDVMVGPNHLNDVTEFLTMSKVPFVVKIRDVQRLLKDHFSELEHTRHRRSISLSSVSKRYLRFSQIKQFLQQVKANASQVNVTLSSLGRTHEGRTTPYITIRRKNSNTTNKPAIIIDAGIHAREWIAPAMALSVIYKLAFNPYNDPEVNELLEKFDWIIVPVLNPDGYVFSHINTSTRLWRKTRSTSYSDDPDCFGVDANRNFGYHWSNSPVNGGSSNPCNDNFSGPRGFSEPETRNLRALLHRERHRTAAYVSLHSYGQFFLYPWGYDSAASLVDENDLNMIGREFSEVMKSRGRRYEVGAAAKVLYEAAGASDDYARGGAGIKYAFTVELSPQDGSLYGFVLPASRIQSVVNDHWSAFKAMALTLWNKTSQAGFRVPPVVNSNDANLVDDDNASDNGSYTYNDSAGDMDDMSEEDAVEAAGGSSREGSTHNSPVITDVMIDGHRYQLDLSNPAVASWLQYYVDYMNYRRDLSHGKRVLKTH